MSITLTAPIVGTRTTWAHVESGFHVASRAGEYVGFAEETADGHFVGFDGRSTPVGRYETLAEAQRAVDAARAKESEPLSSRAQAAFQAAAAVAGVVAVGTFATAVLSSPLL